MLSCSRRVGISPVAMMLLGVTMMAGWQVASTAISKTSTEGGGGRIACRGLGGGGGIPAFTAVPRLQYPWATLRSVPLSRKPLLLCDPVEDLDWRKAAGLNRGAVLLPAHCRLFSRKKGGTHDGGAESNLTSTLAHVAGSYVSAEVTFEERLKMQELPTVFEGQRVDNLEKWTEMMLLYARTFDTVDSDSWREQQAEDTRRTEEVRLNIGRTPRENGVTAPWGTVKERADYNLQRRTRCYKYAIARKVNDAINTVASISGWSAEQKSKFKATYRKGIIESMINKLLDQQVKCYYSGLPLVVDKHWSRLSFERLDNALPHFRLIDDDGNGGVRVDLDNVVWAAEIFQTASRGYGFDRRTLIRMLLKWDLPVPLTPEQRANAISESLPSLAPEALSSSDVAAPNVTEESKLNEQLRQEGMPTVFEGQRGDKLEKWTEMMLLYARTFDTVGSDSWREQQAEDTRRTEEVRLNIGRTPRENGVTAPWGTVKEIAEYNLQLYTRCYKYAIAQAVSKAIDTDASISGWSAEQKSKFKATYEKGIVESMTNKLLDQQVKCYYSGLPLVLERLWSHLSLERLDNSLPHFRLINDDGNGGVRVDLDNVVWAAEIFQTASRGYGFDRKTLIQKLLERDLPVPLTPEQRANAQAELKRLELSRS